jgi:hypothetical protein
MQTITESESPVVRASSGGCNVELTLLNTTVRCATLPLSLLERVFYPLVKLMFYTDDAVLPG